MSCVDTEYYIAASNGCVYKTGFADVINLEEEGSICMVYPNPTTDIAYTTGVKIAEVQVFNTIGQLVKTFQSTNEISLEGLSQGVYLLRITMKDGKVFSDKVVKE